MIITIFQGQGTKNEKSYDLDNSKDVTQFKSKVTRAINSSDLETLKEIKLQLSAIDDEDGFIEEQLDRIKPVIKALKKKPEIIIATTLASYNINDSKRVKDLEKRIIAYGKEEKREKLEKLEKQLIEYPDHAPAKKLSAEVKSLIKALKAPLPYLSYTQLLASEFFQDKREKSAFYTKSREGSSALTKYNDAAMLQRYLSKSVTKKKKTGEENFQDIASYALFDLFRNSVFRQYCHENLSIELLFIVAALSAFSHTASHYPAQGYGKASKLEIQHPGRYFRSENDHPLINEVSRFTKVTKAKERRNFCYGTQNEALIQLMIAQLECQPTSTKKEELIQAQLEAIDSSGRLEGDTLGTGVGPLLSHAGTRANNITQYLSILKTFSELSEENVAQLFPNTSIPDEHISKKVLAKDIEKLHLSFKSFGAGFPGELTENLPEKMAAARTKQVQNIIKASKKLTNIETVMLAESNCLVIKLFPAFQDDNARTSVNFQEGLTNMLVGFFGGLINYNAHVAGLHILVQRRQSFGFLRSTITDRDNLEIRLSLGLEPEVFEQIVIDSLSQFDKILTKYDFIDPENSSKSNKKIVEAVLQSCERKRSVNSQDAGNYLLNAMRTPDDRWIALLVAQKYLDSEKTVEAAFDQYLQKFILDRVDHKKITTHEDHKQIKPFGYTVKQKVDVELDECLDEGELQQIKNRNILFKLFQNLIQVVLGYINNLTEIPNLYICHHLLTKILHACQKGMYILGSLNKFELTHLYAKANLCIESLIEYFTFFRLIIEKESAVDHLVSEEKSSIGVSLGLTPDKFHVTYHDNCQQAIAKNIMMLHEQFKTTKSGRNIQIFLSEKSYYEVSKYCEDMTISRVKLKDTSLAFIDITDIDALEEQILSVKKLQGIIIDITHNSTRLMLNRLASLIEKLHKKNILIVLSCSTLKHEEIGQDKYQSGKNIIIPAQGMQLQDSYLESSEGAMNPILASLRKTVISCFNETGGPTLFQSSKNSPAVQRSKIKINRYA